MIDILFRGMTVENREWVYGYYANCHGAGLEKHTTGHFIIEYPDKWYEIYTDAIGRYTGLCDKNGTKIFEGDIVVKEDKYCKMYGVISFGRHSPTTAELGEIGFYVKWIDGDSNLWSEWIRNDLGFWVDNGVEVIGNIYENKELLEGNE